MPEADAVAVVAPRVVAMALRCRGARRVDAETRSKGEEFDVVAEGDGEPSALGPFVLRPLVNRDVVIAAVRREFHGTCSSAKRPRPPASRVPPSPVLRGRAG